MFDCDLACRNLSDNGELMQTQSYLTPNEICATLKISKGTLQNLIRDGCPCVRIRRSRRFVLADVEAWLAKAQKNNV